MFTGNREPSIAELLEDPIARLLLRRDGVSEQFVWYCVEEARRRLELPLYTDLFAPVTAGGWDLVA